MDVAIFNNSDILYSYYIQIIFIYRYYWGNIKYHIYSSSRLLL